MFVYSLRASTLKFFAVVCVALVTLITLIAFVPSFEEAPASATVGEDGNYTFENFVILGHSAIVMTLPTF